MGWDDVMMGLLLGIGAGTMMGMCVPEERKPEICKRAVPKVSKYCQGVDARVNRMRKYDVEETTRPIVVIEHKQA